MIPVKHLRDWYVIGLTHPEHGVTFSNVMSADGPGAAAANALRYASLMAREETAYVAVRRIDSATLRMSGHALILEVVNIAPPEVTPLSSIAPGSTIERTLAKVKR